MKTSQFLAKWLDIRPKEGREVALSAMGAFFLLAFVVLARSMRKASYLTEFDEKALPYVGIAVACLTLPAVGLFTRLLGSRDPWKVIRVLLLLLAAGLGLLWTVAQRNPVGVVLFYLWAAVGALLLTSGFWVLTAETFVLRGAKRLFGIIIAGGTLGTVVMGLLLGPITRRLDLIWLGPLLVGVLILFFVVQSFVSRASIDRGGADVGGIGCVPAVENTTSFSIGDNLRAIGNSSYLRTIALILLGATMASTIVEYQFLGYARANIGTGTDLTGFLGAFYGWTGGIALLIQLLVAARVLSSGSVALGLGILPVMLLVGSSAFLVAPGLVLAVLLRGTDYSLRKSLLRPMVEFLYVPVSAALRRRTKSFIDVAVDSAGQGAGALVWFVAVTVMDVPSRYLAVLVAAVSIYLFVMSRRMSRLYLNEIVSRLRDGTTGRAEASAGDLLHETHLLTASYSRLDLQSLLLKAEGVSVRGDVSVGGHGSGDTGPRIGSGTAAHEVGESTDQQDAARLLSALRSPKNSRALNALEIVEDWDEDHIRALAGLLVRDSIRERAVEKLVEIGDPAAGVLSEILMDDSADFVIRRRIPRVLAGIGVAKAEATLFEALLCRRFEVRYRAALALVRLMKRGSLEVTRERQAFVWKAVEKEVDTNRPVWEMQRLLDDFSAEEEDDLVTRRVGVRGELSLEHTFRMLTLVLDPRPLMAAFHGIVLADESLRSFALEYLEQVLPAVIRERLWLFIGDVSEYRKAEELRPIDEVVSDLMSSRATLFGGERERDALMRLLKGGHEP